MNSFTQIESKVTTKAIILYFICLIGVGALAFFMIYGSRSYLLNFSSDSIIVLVLCLIPVVFFVLGVLGMFRLKHIVIEGDQIILDYVLFPKTKLIDLNEITRVVSKPYQIKTDIFSAAWYTGVEIKIFKGRKLLFSFNSMENTNYRNVWLFLRSGVPITKKVFGRKIR